MRVWGLGLGFRVQGSGFRVGGLGLRGFIVRYLAESRGVPLGSALCDVRADAPGGLVGRRNLWRFRVKVMEVRVYGRWFMVECLGLR